MQRRASHAALATWIGVLAAGCHSPIAPDPFNEAGVGSSHPGYSLTILSATPAPQSTIDWRQGPSLARVRVGYERPAASTVRLTVCLARDTSTLIFSSCRDMGLAMKGEADGYAGIYRVNDVVAWSETRYILAFLVAGDLVPDRRRYEDEIAIDRLTEEVFSAQRLEHLLYWR